MKRTKIKQAQKPLCETPARWTQLRTALFVVATAACAGGLGAACSDDDGGTADLCQDVDCPTHEHCAPETGVCVCDDGYVRQETDCVSARVTDLEDLPLDAESFWNGQAGAGGLSSFSTGDATFSNFYDHEYDYWEGFAYSNTTDITTPGFDNQYSAITGAGAAGSSNYAVGYYATFYGNPPPTIRLTDTTAGYVLDGVSITNTTFAYLAMRDGDDVSKKFGGASGADQDWFLLSIYGITAQKQRVGPVEVYLADFRGPSAEDYILAEWTWVDLSGLGAVVGLQFELSSSDTGDYGMNTPAYFALDNLTRTAPSGN